MADTPGTPFYVTTPIYYVNDVPHIGHAYTTVAADVLARWRRLWGDDVVFLTGTDEHGLKIQRAAEAQASPRRSGPTATARASATPGTLPRHHERRLHPHHRAPPPRGGAGVPPAGLRQRRHRARHLRGPVLRRVRGSTTPRTSSSTGKLPDPRHARSSASPRRTTSSGSRASRTGCSSTTPRIPRRCSPTASATRCSGFIKQGLRDFSMSRTSITWGIPLPWDPQHVAYVWFDALINYCTAVGYGDDRDRFDRYWPADYHLIGKDILRFHAVYWPAMLMAAGEAPPQTRVRARLPARGRREDEQDARSTRSRPPISSPTSASTASATTSSPTSASVPTATSATRRWSRATTPTSPTTSATSRTAC